MPERILFIHGFGSNPTIFETQQCPPLKSALESQGYQIEFIQGRYKIGLDDYPYSPPDRDPVKLDLYSWWDMKREPSLELTSSFIKSLNDEANPIVGVIGLSQGGALSTLIAANHKEWIPTLKFAISYAGFFYPKPFEPMETDLSAYNEKISIPFLSFIGLTDDVIIPKTSEQVANDLVAEGKGTVLYHDGGHIVPIDEENLQKALDWINSLGLK